jgi:hypothetical protein
LALPLSFAFLFAGPLKSQASFLHPELPISIAQLRRDGLLFLYRELKNHLGKLCSGFWERKRRATSVTIGTSAKIITTSNRIC